MAVAKSYIGLPQKGEPYEKNKRMYVDIITKSGKLKSVRWYSDSEFASMYPDLKIDNPKGYKLRDTLGFGEKGYIYIFKCDDEEKYRDWFWENNIRRHGWWSWFSNDLPVGLPEGLEAVPLYWKNVGLENGDVADEETVRKAVFEARGGQITSSWVGEIGERLDLSLTVREISYQDGSYGAVYMYKMEDDNGNRFFWKTSAQKLSEGATYSLRGSVKARNTDLESGQPQTVLTRCILQK